MSLRDELADREYAAGYSESYALSYIAAQIKVLREQRGLSQDDLAAKIGTKQPAISRLEDCNNSPNIRTLFKLAEAFGLRLCVHFESFDGLPDEVSKFRRNNLQR